ncbi:hypothetical protein HanHA300_Chr05g0163371 [Helianthus annuus]|nr:hypothetical protein HanHA300_Chr05g0163371 [Helianthus annuus]KAJ0583497.1 hypothetical protein HanHA89_Chr05g0177261 [Helianthus annuus]
MHIRDAVGALLTPMTVHLQLKVLIFLQLRGQFPQIDLDFGNHYHRFGKPAAQLRGPPCHTPTDGGNIVARH